MTRYVFSMLAATLLAGGAANAQVDRENDVDVDAGPVQVQVDTDRPVRADARPDTATKTHLMRISEIVGMEVMNGNGDELGDINDVVIDVNSGEIRYAALASGGFLGIGEKLLAVPWNEFALQERDDEHFLVLSIDKERLEQAPGFDADKWPASSDKSWGEVDKYYAPRDGAEVRTEEPLR